MKSLYTETSTYTQDGIELYKEVKDFVIDIFNRWVEEKGFHPRDVETIFYDQIRMESLFKGAYIDLENRRKELESITQPFGANSPLAGIFY